MVSLEVIAILLSGISISASLFYYANVLQNANKTQKQQLETRQTQLFLQLYGTDTEEQISKISNMIVEWKWENVEDYYSKYGNRDNYSKRSSCLQIYNGLGLLAMRKQIDLDLIYQYSPAPIIGLWGKFGEILIYERSYIQRPEYYQGLEFLYNEMMKRETPGSPTLGGLLKP